MRSLRQDWNEADTGKEYWQLTEAGTDMDEFLNLGDSMDLQKP